MVKRPYAQLPIAAFDLAEKVDRRRNKLRPETAKGAVADLCVMADRAPDGCISYNPRYWGIRWEWNDNEVARLLSRLVKAGVFSVKKNGDKSRSLISSKNNVSRTAIVRHTESKQETREESGVGGKIVSMEKANCKQIVSELPPTKEKEKRLSAPQAQDAVVAKSGNRKRTLSPSLSVLFLEFWAAWSDPRGRAEAAWAFYEIDNLSAELVREVIIPAAKAYAIERVDMLRKGRTPKMAQGWLNGLRWQDYHPSSASAGMSAAEETRQRLGL